MTITRALSAATLALCAIGVAGCETSSGDGEPPLSSFVFATVTSCRTDAIEGRVRNASTTRAVNVVVRWEVVNGHTRLDDGVEFFYALGPKQEALWSSPLFDVGRSTCSAVVDSVSKA